MLTIFGRVRFGPQKRTDVRLQQRKRHLVFVDFVRICMTILEYGVCTLHSLAISRPRTQSLDYQRERYSADAARVLRTSRIVLHPEKIELLQNTRMIYMSVCLGAYAGTLLNRDSGQSDCTWPRRSRCCRLRYECTSAYSGTYLDACS